MSNIETTARNKLYILSLAQIEADLTTGREDNDLPPYSNDYIRNYIETNNDRILQMIDRIVYDFKQDNELDELTNPEQSLIREYLPDYFPDLYSDW